MDSKEFLDVISLIGEHPSGNLEMFDGGRGERLQEVLAWEYLGSAYIELLNVW